jgi:hypothetical protein
MRVEARPNRPAHTKGLRYTGVSRANGPAIAPRCSACPDGKESHACPERGIPCRGLCTRVRSGRFRLTRYLNIWGSRPARAALSNMRLASWRAFLAAGRSCACSQNNPTTPNRIFSSASQVITCKVRSRAGVAAPTHLLLIARSRRVGGNVTRPRCDIRSSSQGADERRPVSLFAFGHLSVTPRWPKAPQS